MRKYIFLTPVLLGILLYSNEIFASVDQGQDPVPEPFSVLPVPREYIPLQGKGIEYADLKEVYLINLSERPEMGEMFDHLPYGRKQAPGVFTLERSDDKVLPESEEGYVLEIQNGQVHIRSRGMAGLFYGCQTMDQLAGDSQRSGQPVPACRITDYPEMDYRAVQIDVKHHLDNMNVYYESIDRLARYKINAVVFEFEDKLRYRRQPLVGAPQAISIDEMAALTAYASKRNIEITPLVQGLGHASFILKHQLYAHLREQDENRWAFCPLHEGTYQVLFDLYRDAIEATPGSRYLHVGGDEIGSIGLCPRCKPTADEAGTLSLNIYWLNRVSDFAIKHGRIPIFWDDMPLKEAGVYNTAHRIMPIDEVERLWEKGEKKLTSVLDDFPDTCIFMRWNYSTGKQPGNIRALEYYQENDLGVMVATAAQSGPAALFPFDDRNGKVTDHGIPAIKSFLELSAERGIEGMLCTAWDDRSLHLETMWRGYIAAAQYSWNPGSLPLDAFDQLYLRKEYGTSIPEYAALYVNLRSAADFWEEAFNPTSDRLDRYNALLPLPGIGHRLTPEESEKIRSSKVDYRQKLIELPDPDHPGTWSEKYADRLGKAHQLLREYPGNAEKLQKLYLSSTGNRYHWEVFMALNKFQITAPKLLIALEMCDKGTAKATRKGMEQVQLALEEFDRSWEQLKEVYAETRFIAYPPDYVPDRYHHFASQREDLSYLIQVEEIFHGMVRDWKQCNQGSGNAGVELPYEEEAFEKEIDEKSTSLYVMRNKQGMLLTLSDYGARIVSLYAPDKHGKMEDVVLGCSDIDQYINGNPGVGAVIGPVTNRISGAWFEIEGMRYDLPDNKGGVCLHSGPDSFYRQVWEGRKIPCDTGSCVEMYLFTPDGRWGFPGNKEVTVRYTLTDQNALVIDYTATTDKRCHFNLTNHAYFNLDGPDCEDILNHYIEINADSFTPFGGNNLVPSGEIRSVKGTDLDFTRSVRIGERIESRMDQMQLVGGYDHNYVLNQHRDSDRLTFCARVFEPVSGRVMECYTTEPAVQFYTANFLDGTMRGNGRDFLTRRSGLCLETQHYPDSPHHDHFPSTLLEPGDTLRSRTIYRFSHKPL